MRIPVRTQDVVNTSTPPVVLPTIYAPPSVGGVATYVPKEGFVGRVRAIICDLTTSAVVASRRPRLILYDVGKDAGLWMSLYSNNQNESTTRIMMWLPGGAYQSTSNMVLEMQTMSMPDAEPSPTLYYSCRIDNWQAGDVMTMKVLVDEWPDRRYGDF